jgi:hypothetical protein
MSAAPRVFSDCVDGVSEPRILEVLPAPGWFRVLEEDPSQDVFDEQFAPIAFALVEQAVPGFDPPTLVRSVIPLTVANQKGKFSLFAMDPGPNGLHDVRYFGRHGDPRRGDKPLYSMREIVRDPFAAEE